MFDIQYNLQTLSSNFLRIEGAKNCLFCSNIIHHGSLLRFKKNSISDWIFLEIIKEINYILNGTINIIIPVNFNVNLITLKVVDH